MAKRKIKKSLIRRIKVTKTGKMLHRSSFARHLRSKKSASQKRRQAHLKGFLSTIAKKIRKLI